MTNHATEWRARLLAIESNGAALGQVEEIVRSGCGLAFVGAGASAGLYPLWPGLFRIASDELRARGLAADKELDTWREQFTRSPQDALEAVRTRLGNAIYRDVLRTAFRPKAGFDGYRFSPLHRLVIELGFRGIVTTNYDPGLLEARRALRPGAGITGYVTWRDDEGLREWFDESTFNSLGAPILFAHGMYERPDTVVLTESEYQHAYREGPYRRLLERLIVRGRFVFVGVSFSDPWFEQVVSTALKNSAPSLSVRHVALLPLRQSYSESLRRRYMDIYDVNPIFYPVESPGGHGEDHSDVLLVLKSMKSLVPLLPSRSQAVAESTQVPIERGELALVGAEVFAGRSDALKWLDEVCADSAVRIAAIRGLGGTGKTALINQWIAHRRGHTSRTLAAILAWSFDERHDTAHLLVTLMDLGATALGWQRPPGSTPLEACRDLLGSRSLLIILDGVERLQSTMESSTSCALLDEDLRQLLIGGLQTSSQTLFIITSRLPLVDLETWLGKSVRELELIDLPDAEGALLLELGGVKATSEQLEDMSRQLHGNPLALRILADLIARSETGTPMDILASIGPKDAAGSDQWRSLLSFYEQSLSPLQAALLSSIALMESAPQKMVATVLRGVSATKSASDGRSDADLHVEIDSLATRQLVQRSTGRGDDAVLSCHPIVRGHFRSSLLSRDANVAIDAITALQIRPEDFHIMTDEDQIVGLALLDALIVSGYFGPAWVFFRGRFRQQFEKQDDIARQLRTYLSFVATPDRRAGVKQHSADLLSFLLSAVVVVALGAGQLRLAKEYGAYLTEGESAKRPEDLPGIPVVNNAIVMMHCGDFAEAVAQASTAAAVLDRSGDIENFCLALAIKGYAFALSGRLRESEVAYREALKRWPEFVPWDSRYGALGFSHTGNRLEGYSGMLLAEIFFRRRQYEIARELLIDNIGVCGDNEWIIPSARCEWLLGRIECASGQIDEAERTLLGAIRTFRKASSGLDLGWALISLSDVHRQRKQWDAALATLADALAAIGGQEKPLQYIDGLILRGRILLDRARREAPPGSVADRFDIGRAIDLGKNALELARKHTYAWAELDAARLLFDAYAADGVEASADEFHRHAAMLEARLIDQGEWTPM